MLGSPSYPERAMPSPYTAILLDLDGTIVDSAPGILSSLTRMLEQMGRPVPPPAELLEWVGPPLLDSMRDLAGFDEEEVARALAFYRADYLASGVHDATVFEGMPEAVRAIAASGTPLSLATSKPEGPATAILTGVGIADCFDAITGASDDEVRSAKADVVEEALRRLRLQGADLTNVVHIGDRIHDVEGAAAHGIPTIFVDWGYGSPAEQAGAIAVVDSATALLAELGIGGIGAPESEPLSA